ncbi:MAG: RNA polymerase sigma-70 factor [Chitinophagaceae bacterium]|nr:RNA polymerase sigma-70 factor [Chitinophagaceae bacterium]
MLANREQELLLKIASGSEAAFRELFQTYRKKLFSYIFKITASREMAEDAIQEIFLKLWAVRETLPAIGNINAYLHRMAHNYAYHGFRRLAKETLLLDHLSKQEDSDRGNPVQELLSKEVTVYIQSLVDRLTPQQRKVFLLSREEGLKQEEIASRLNVSISTVKKHMVDALAFLREEIRQNYGLYAVALFVIYRLYV